MKGPTPSHFGICVTDMDRSLRFWCDGLGFTPAESYDLASAELPGLDAALEVDGPVAVRSQFIELDNLRIELLSFRSPGVEGRPSFHRNHLGLTHVSLNVDDVDAWAARVVNFGGTILEPTRAHLGIEIVFVTDPDGVRVELMGTLAD